MDGFPKASDIFQRAVSSPQPRTAVPPLVGLVERLQETIEVEIDYDELVPEIKRGRSVSEPAPLRQQGLGLVAALDAVDVHDGQLVCRVRRSLHVLVRCLQPSEAAQRTRRPTTLMNVMLCVVSLLTGCMVPVLVDLSRTATALGPGGKRVQRLPYSALSVLQAEAAFNVGLGLLAIATRRSPGGFAPLFRADLHCMMLPLTLVYCLGDMAALFAIGSGGGPLYVAVSNSRLIFAAAASRAVLGRHQSLRQWLLLVEITAAAAAYAALSTRKAAGSADAAEMSRASAGVVWAVAKAMLSGTAAVLTESRYKRLNLWHANTLLKAQSLVVAGTISVLCSAAMEDMPPCPASPWCVEWRGWDRWTYAVLTAEIGAGWLSVAMLTRMSAVAKFVCKTATAPSIYLAYCAVGGLHFEIKRFVSVVAIALGILAYTVEPYLKGLRCAFEKRWVCEYPRSLRQPT